MAEFLGSVIQASTRDFRLGPRSRCADSAPVKRARRAYTHLVASRIATIYAAGVSEREIARRYGWSQSAVHRRLVREGILRRPVTCGNEPRVEITCEVCGERVMRRAYLVRIAKHRLCGRYACRMVCWLRARPPRRRVRGRKNTPPVDRVLLSDGDPRIGGVCGPDLSDTARTQSPSERLPLLNEQLAATGRRIAELEAEHARLVSNSGPGHFGGSWETRAPDPPPPTRSIGHWEIFR